MDKERIYEVLKKYIGEDNSDEAIEVLETVREVLDYEAGENWEQKYRDLDNSWRERYKRRFFEKVEDVVEEFKDDEDYEEEKTYKYEELFEEDNK